MSTPIEWILDADSKAVHSQKGRMPEKSKADSKERPWLHFELNRWVVIRYKFLGSQHGERLGKDWCLTYRT